MNGSFLKNDLQLNQGIAALDGTGRSNHGACDLHHVIWTIKNARPKMLSEVAQLPIMVTQPTYYGCPTYLLWLPNLCNVCGRPIELNVLTQPAISVWSPNRV